MNNLQWRSITDHKSAPSTCGVYQYWQNDKILYIGKAINLKARLASHAQNAKLDEKERAIVSGATEIRYTEVDSEFLALLLEAALIREHMPPYNRIWKDDKTYLYIVIDTKDPYPRPYFARAHTLKKSNFAKRNSKLKIFGPFPNTNIAEEVLRAIRRLIPFCMSKSIGRHNCFYSKIGLCDPCPATIKITNDMGLKKQYRKQIFQVIKILSGNIDPVIKDLNRDLKKASNQQDYETALKLRTKIERFTSFTSHHSFRENTTIYYNTSTEKISALSDLLSPFTWSLSPNPRVECYDASNSSLHDSVVSMVVSTNGLIDRGQYRRFKIKNPRANNDFDRLYEALFRRLKNNTWDKPDLIVIDGGAPQLSKLRPLFDQLTNPIYFIGIAKHPDHLVIPREDGSFSNIQPDRFNLGFRHLQELRDEAHRFANNYRKILQSKRTGI
ncbi:MAG: excinuclease ABC subunit UvrC [Candidatus Microgenomates bacterium]